MLRFLVNDPLKNMFNLERGLFYIIIELFKQPEVVIKDYLDSDGYRYMNPFRFQLVVASLCAIVVSIFGFSIEGIIEMEDGNPMDLDFVKEYSNLIILINVPLVAFGAWLAFRPSKLNYAEHLVINAYAYSFMTIVSIPFDIVFSAFFTIDRYLLGNDFISAAHPGDFLHLYSRPFKKYCKRHFENNTDLHFCRAFFDLYFHSNFSHFKTNKRLTCSSL